MISRIAGKIGRTWLRFKSSNLSVSNHHLTFLKSPPPSQTGDRPSHRKSIPSHPGLPVATSLTCELGSIVGIGCRELACIFIRLIYFILDRNEHYRCFMRSVHFGSRGIEGRELEYVEFGQAGNKRPNRKDDRTRPHPVTLSFSAR